MALSDIRTYFKERLTSVDDEFREWKDAFNINNVPSTFYNKFYHISYGTLTGQNLSSGQFAVQEIELKAGFKGFKDVSAQLDTAIDLMESLVSEVQDPTTRLGTVIKNVKFNSMSVGQSFESNDNLILVTQQYSVTVFLC